MADKKAKTAFLSEEAFDDLHSLSMLFVPSERERYLREKDEFEKALTLIGLLGDESDRPAAEDPGTCSARDDEPMPPLTRGSLTASACRTDGRFVIVKGILDTAEGGGAADETQ